MKAAWLLIGIHAVVLSAAWAQECPATHPLDCGTFCCPTAGGRTDVCCPNNPVGSRCTSDGTCGGGSGGGSGSSQLCNTSGIASGCTSTTPFTCEASSTCHASFSGCVNDLACGGSGSSGGGGGFAGCTNSCQFAFDGTCDDGSPGASFSVCDRGTDCSDCTRVSGGGPGSSGGGGGSTGRGGGGYTPSGDEARWGCQVVGGDGLVWLALGVAVLLRWRRS